MLLLSQKERSCGGEQFTPLKRSSECSAVNDANARDLKLHIERHLKREMLKLNLSSERTSEK